MPINRPLRYLLYATAVITLSFATVSSLDQLSVASAAAQSGATTRSARVPARKSPARKVEKTQKPDSIDQTQSVELRSPKVQQAEHHDVSPPLYAIPPALRRGGQKIHEHEILPRQFNRGGRDTVVQSTMSPALAPATLLNFNGVGNGFSGPQGSFTVNSAPPDTNGDVGPNHYVQIVNSDFAIFNKSGTPIFGPVPINTLWSGFGGGCQLNNDGDPVVVYDPIADRWVISQFSVSTTPYLQCVAVSTSPDPTGTWNRYSFNYGNTEFPDYPKMGVWPDAYYITFNIFNNGQTFAGTKICAYDRSKMLAGLAATQQCFPNTTTSFGGLLPSDLDGATLPPAGSPNYIVGLGATLSTLAFWKAHVDFTTPANSTLTGPTQLTTATYSEACAGGTCIPQSGTTQQLDSLGDRVMFRLAYRNFGNHEALVVNHSVTAGSSTGVRWYELRPDASHNLSIFQQGTYAPDASFRWMGSIAMDQSGNMGLGFSVSSSTLHPQIHYTGRLASSPLGQMDQGEGTIINGPGSQTGFLSRWGDYSMMAVDPTDDCTFWYTTEYLPANGSFNWSTRIATFKFPGCGGTITNDFSISANPTSVSVAQGASDTSTISTAVTSGSAETVSLSASGLPAGASASFNPASVAAGTSSTLTLTAGAATTPGTYTVTVTGTAPSATHTTSVSFTVTPPATNDFSISANPTSVSVNQGASGPSTISTAVTSGVAQTVSLSASGLPTGASASFNPTSVTAGGSSTLTLTAGAATPTGTYTVTVTGTGASATHTTSISFTVTSPPPPNDFSISANPNSVSVNQGASGPSTISTAVTSGVAQTVSLSASGLPSGASASFNPTSVTAGGSSTLTLTAGAGTPTGTYTVTVTGTGASATHTTGISFTVTSPPPPNDFSISANPNSVTVVQGASGPSTISTAVTSGVAQTVNLSASGLPAGASASFNPTSVTAGNSSTLTLKAGANTTPGTYNVTVTGTGASATHATAVSFTVTSAGGGIVNGGFETGNLSGWTSVGTTSVVSSGAHSGAFAAQVGGTGPTNGDSSLSQTFTVTSKRFSFWYQVHCTGTVSTDWAMVTLTDNVTGKTFTLLTQTCTNNNTWVVANINVARFVGHTVTLRLINHDNNDPSNPTYTLFDDFVIQ